jgi:hypothetical protein
MHLDRPGVHLGVFEPLSGRDEPPQQHRQLREPIVHVCLHPAAGKLHVRRRSQRGRLRLDGVPRAVELPERAAARAGAVQCRARRDAKRLLLPSVARAGSGRSQGTSRSGTGGALDDVQRGREAGPRRGAPAAQWHVRRARHSSRAILSSAAPMAGDLSAWWWMIFQTPPTR